MNRRRFLTLGASGLVIGLAGCSSDSGSGTDDADGETTGGTADATTTGASGTAAADAGSTTVADSPTETGSPMADGSGTGTTASSLSPDENPQELVVQFYRYLDAGDTEAAAALVHPQSPSRGENGEVFSDSESVQAMEQNDLTVRSASALSGRFPDNDSRTVVEAQVSLSADSDARTIQWEVRKADGNWRIWAQTQPQ